MFSFRSACRSVFVMGLFGVTLCLLPGCTPAGPRAVLQGEKYLQQGRVDEAVERLEKAVELLPEEPRAWNLLGVAYHRAGRPADAERAYGKALERDRNLAVARFNLGALLLERGEADRAVLELSTFTGLQVNSLEGWLKLGEAQLQAGQPSEAERSFIRAYNIETNSAVALNGLAISLVERQRYREAWQYFSGALQRDPQFASAWLNAGVLAQQHLRQTNLAVQAFERYLALTNAPRRGEVELLLAALRPVVQTNLTAAGDGDAGASGEPDEAEEPVSPAGTNVLAAVEEEDGGEVVVGEQEEGVLSEPVKPVESTNQPASVVARVVEEPEVKPPPIREKPVEQRRPVVVATNPPPVRQTVRKPEPKPEVVRPPAAVDVPDDLKAYDGPRYPYYAYKQPAEGDRNEAIRLLNLGINDQRALRTRLALESYRRAVEVDPSLFETHYNRGVAAFELGILDEAMRAYELALTVNPDSVPARFNFATTLQKAGYLVDAAAQLVALSGAHPDETRVHMALGNLYADVFRDHEKAKAYYSRVLELEPEHPNATSLRFWIEAH